MCIFCHTLNESLLVFTWTFIKSIVTKIESIRNTTYFAQSKEKNVFAMGATILKAPGYTKSTTGAASTTITLENDSNVCQMSKKPSKTLEKQALK